MHFAVAEKQRGVLYYRIIIAALGVFAIFSLLAPHVVFAQDAPAGPAPGELRADAITAQDLGLFYGEATGLGTTDIRITIARIIRIVLGLLGIIAVVIVIGGGVIWMTAGGDEKKVLLAKKVLTNGAIGLAIILSAFAITSFIMKSLTDATTGVGGL
ncbi:MAG: hypothetical protein AAB912_00470, partial [Patescibacteria group bacterium]